MVHEPHVLIGINYNKLTAKLNAIILKYNNMIQIYIDILNDNQNSVYDHWHI